MPGADVPDDPAGTPGTTDGSGDASDDPGDDPRGDREDRPATADSPIEGQALLLAGTKASVAPRRLPDLVRRAAADLRDRRATYERSRERVVDADEAGADADAYLVPTGHWSAVGERLGLDAREADAVRRAHAEQLRRFGSETGRRDEFETALEIREAVVIER